jgi:hypothetical protein
MWPQVVQFETRQLPRHCRPEARPRMTAPSVLPQRSNARLSLREVAQMAGRSPHRFPVRLVAVAATAAALVGSAASVGKAVGRADPGQAARGRALNELYGKGATTMSLDELRAMHLRSVALNKLYHLGDFTQLDTRTQRVDTSTQADRARGEWLNAEFGNAATRMSPAEFHALYLRSDALDRQYHLGDDARHP